MQRGKNAESRPVSSTALRNSDQLVVIVGMLPPAVNIFYVFVHGRTNTIESPYSVNLHARPRTTLLVSTYTPQPMQWPIAQILIAAW